MNSVVVLHPEHKHSLTYVREPPKAKKTKRNGESSKAKKGFRAPPKTNKTKMKKSGEPSKTNKTKKNKNKGGEASKAKKTNKNSLVQQNGLEDNFYNLKMLAIVATSLRPSNESSENAHLNTLVDLALDLDSIQEQPLPVWVNANKKKPTKDISKEPEVYCEFVDANGKRCQSGLFDKSSISRHMDTHYNKKKFRCPFCGITILQSYNMTHHAASHAGKLDVTKEFFDQLSPRVQEKFLISLRKYRIKKKIDHTPVRVLITQYCT